MLSKTVKEAEKAVEYEHRPEVDLEQFRSTESRVNRILSDDGELSSLWSAVDVDRTGQVALPSFARHVVRWPRVVRSPTVAAGCTGCPQARVVFARPTTPAEFTAPLSRRADDFACSGLLCQPLATGPAQASHTMSMGAQTTTLLPSKARSQTEGSSRWSRKVFSRRFSETSSSSSRPAACLKPWTAIGAHPSPWKSSGRRGFHLHCLSAGLRGSLPRSDWCLTPALRECPNACTLTLR